jgi:tRNA uridine 5-carboxymethylaminomethyl modification enzyme
LRQIEGFNQAKIFRPGYAIEYDYFPPEQLYHTLETKLVANLYFAGQINGTTGYEEAAAQGLMAGINAHLKIKDQEPLVLKRSEAYIGVLIDDLITKGVDEPYRMFTSRAEYRILLRQDNADQRLTGISHKLGLASIDRYEKMLRKKETIDDLMHLLKKVSLSPEQVNPLLEKKGTPPISQKQKAASVLLRPQIGIADLLPLINNLNQRYSTTDGEMTEMLEEAEILIKYEGYIAKEKEIADKLGRLEDVKLRPDFNYEALTSLSFEAREKLGRLKPSTLGQASRISGVSPSDISVLAIFLGR